MMEIELHFGEYTITINTDQSGGYMWLTNKGGEGMSLWPEEMERMLDAHFKHNF